MPPLSGESVTVKPGKPQAGHFIAFIPEDVGDDAGPDTMLEEAPCRLLVEPDREGGAAIVRLDIGAEGEGVILARLDDVDTALAQAKEAAHVA